MNQGQRVLVTGTYEALPGTIVGTAHYVLDGVTNPGYIVRLDTGFWNEDRTLWFILVVVHRNALELAE